MDIRSKQYAETKKVSKVEEIKNCKTFEQCAKRYMPFARACDDP